MNVSNCRVVMLLKTALLFLQLIKPCYRKLDAVLMVHWKPVWKPTQVGELKIGKIGFKGTLEKSVWVLALVKLQYLDQAAVDAALFPISVFMFSMRSQVGQFPCCFLLHVPEKQVLTVLKPLMCS